MGSSWDVSDEPLTPIGRLFTQDRSANVFHFALGMKHPIDVEAVKASMKDSVMVKHPRFCSLVVRDSRGVDHWKRTDIDIDSHFIIVDDPVGSMSNRTGSGDGRDDEAAVNEYLADLSFSTSEFNELKPLWEIHILKAHRCMILRIHHALGDGMALMSMIMMLCRRVDDPSSFPTVSSSSSSSRSLIRRPSSWFQAVAKLVQRVWLTIVFALGFSLRFTWVRDPKNPISGGDGVELWPRKLATARFRLDDMKLVKRVLPGATINDVLTGVVSLGLYRYLDQKWPGRGKQMTGVAAVNLRKQPGLLEFAKLMTKDPSMRWGNVVAMMLLPFPMYNSNNPLDHVTKAKEILDRKKSSFEAAFLYRSTGLVIAWFGAKVSNYFVKRLVCNTTFGFSNMVGPQEEVSYFGNPITYIRANVSSTQHSLMMHMMSYAGRADLQILVAKDIIPDPEFLAECFEGALKDIKGAVEEALSRHKEE